MNQRARIMLSVGLVLAVAVGVLLDVLLSPAPPKPAPTPALSLAYPFLASPHFDERPPDATIDAVIIHATTIDSMQETIDYFLEPSTEVSTHFIVDRDGAVVQIVPVEKRAWHAGVSMLGGVKHVNDFSVGIELVNLNNGEEEYPELQYQATAGIIRLLRSQYQIPDERVLSHAAVAMPIGRKTDPLGFDLSKLVKLTH